MALTGIEIFKMLPKTNCKECGFPTCLAFAMALAKGQAKSISCNYLTDDIRKILPDGLAQSPLPLSDFSEHIGRKINNETIGEIAECQKKGEENYQLIFNSKTDQSCCNMKILFLRVILDIETIDNKINKITKSIQYIFDHGNKFPSEIVQIDKLAKEDSSFAIKLLDSITMI